MKKLFIITAITSLLVITSNLSNAQISVNVNIGTQPTWIPSGYQNVSYYYLPDIGAYYNVPTRQFIYVQNNVWVKRNHLPKKHRNYNLNRGRKIVHNGPIPFGNYHIRPDRYAYNNHMDNKNKYYKPSKKDHNNGRYDKRQDRKGGRNHRDGRH